MKCLISSVAVSRADRPGGSNVSTFTDGRTRGMVSCVTNKSPGSPLDALKITRTWRMTLAALMLEIRLDGKRFRYIIAANRSQGPGI